MVVFRTRPYGVTLFVTRQRQLRMAASSRKGASGRGLLQLELPLVLRGKANIGQREEEGHQLVDLLLGQGQRLDAAVQERIGLPALVVVVHHVPQRGHRPVVHVRGR